MDYHRGYWQAMTDKAVRELVAGVDISVSSLDWNLKDGRWDVARGRSTKNLHLQLVPDALPTKNLETMLRYVQLIRAGGGMWEEQPYYDYCLLLQQKLSALGWNLGNDIRLDPKGALTHEDALFQISFNYHRVGEALRGDKQAPPPQRFSLHLLQHQAPATEIKDDTNLNERMNQLVELEISPEYDAVRNNRNLAAWVYEHEYYELHHTDEEAYYAYEQFHRAVKANRKDIPIDRPLTAEQFRDEMPRLVELKRQGCAVANWAVSEGKITMKSSAAQNSLSLCLLALDMSEGYKPWEKLEVVRSAHHHLGVGRKEKLRFPLGAEPGAQVLRQIERARKQNPDLYGDNGMGFDTGRDPKGRER
jgi:hypothetical protein